MILGILKKMAYLASLGMLSQGVLADVPIPRGDWQRVEEKAQNTVVQVWAQIAEFNWLDPYRSPEQKQGAGSGFLITDQGYVLTNYHVVKLATSVYVNIPCIGRKPIEASIIGVCPDLDIALLKLSDYGMQLIRSQLKRLPVLELGNSDELTPAQEVLALGYPLGFRDLKSTVGVIAGREFLNGMSYMSITAATNPGNSGGPLLSTQGKVVGINTAGIPMIQQGNQMIPIQNISYIVPINDIKTVLSNLYIQKLVRRPFLGVDYNHATDEHAHSLGNPIPGGIYVNQVIKGSFADKLGIKEGDMLYEIECGKHRYAIDEYGDVIVNWRGSTKISVPELLIRFKIGDTIKLILCRNGARMEVQGTFDVLPLSPVREIYPEFEPEEIDYEMIAGAVIMQLRENHLSLLPPIPHLRRYLDFDHYHKQALVITRILPGSQMHMVECFYAGALLDQVNGQKVRTLKELRQALMVSIKTGNLSISIKGKQYAVLSLKKVLQDEERLAAGFKYQTTEMVQKLKAMSQKLSVAPGQ